VHLRVDLSVAKNLCDGCGKEERRTDDTPRAGDGKGQAFA
jgi:hypothetical protein